MDTQNDYLKALWISTYSLYERFGLKPTREAVTLKLLEEVGESISAMYENSRVKLAEELADVMVCVMGIAIREGISALQLQSAMYGVACKNDAKSECTHEVRTGTICKR